ncbi:hypothetical protein D8B26_005688 [Coccidioides posadasii str. Silveira]|uniref:uncharacterized protein n=1 Tax=Coccidioides posadasii (strain RMSCC 757 / Silveira) TaxID=443226 RepID=UPI001BEEC9A7|nr:hypothetical protein D8B26_005688 [Coccidioides posadasii str. Silveira]
MDRYYAPPLVTIPLVQTPGREDFETILVLNMHLLVRALVLAFRDDNASKDSRLMPKKTQFFSDSMEDRFTGMIALHIITPVIGGAVEELAAVRGDITKRYRIRTGGNTRDKTWELPQRRHKMEIAHRGQNFSLCQLHSSPAFAKSDCRYP